VLGKDLAPPMYCSGIATISSSTPSRSRLHMTCSH
jgi:hypothetical protein